MNPEGVGEGVGEVNNNINIKMPYLCLVETLHEPQPKIGNGVEDKVGNVDVAGGSVRSSVSSSPLPPSVVASTSTSTLQQGTPPIGLCEQRKPLRGVKTSKTSEQVGLKTLNGVVKSRAVNGISRLPRPPYLKLELERGGSSRSSSTCRTRPPRQDNCKVGGVGGYEKQPQRPLPQKGTGRKENVQIKDHLANEGGTGNDDGDGNTTFEGILLSLQSPFPNEHELALGTCLRLSAVGGLTAGRGKGLTEVNLLGRNPAILRMLLGHAGFYQDCGLRELMEETLLGAFGLDFASFWRELCGAHFGLHELLCECYPGELTKMTEVEKGILLGLGVEELGEMGMIENLKCCKGCQEPGLLAQMKMGSEGLPFTLARSSGNFQEKLERRVHLIGVILRNFSFQEEDAKTMARHPTMLRFLLVLAQIDHGEFPQLAFDIISNISRYMGPVSKDNLSKSVEYQQLVSNLVNLMMAAVLDSSDRHKILCGLEALAGVARGDDKQIGARVISPELVARLFQLLTLKQDKILSMGCLECLLALSELGMEFCEEIAQVQGSVSTLMVYLNENSPRRSSPPSKICNPVLSSNITPNQGNEQTSHSCGVLQPIGHACCSQTALMQASVCHNYQTQTMVSTWAVGKVGNEEVLHKIKNLVINNTHQVQPKDFAGDYTKLRQRHSHKEIKLFRLNTNGDIHEMNVRVDRAEQLKITSRLEKEGLHLYLCEWDGCNARAKTAKMLRWHVIRKHYPNLADQSCCRWAIHNRTPEQFYSCSVIRGKFSLQTHLELNHCTEHALELALHRRKNGIQPPSFPLKALEMYPIQNDGGHGSSSLEKLYLTYPLPREEANSEKENKNAVTKSIRLTAALILRNLAKYSRIARRSLSWYEPELAEIATRGYDCSGMIAKLLYCISLGDNQEEDD